VKGKKNHYRLSSAFATAYTILKKSLQRIELKKWRVCLDSLLELQMELVCNSRTLQSPCSLCILSQTLLMGLCFIAKGIITQESIKF